MGKKSLSKEFVTESDDDDRKTEKVKKVKKGKEYLPSYDEAVETSSDEEKHPSDDIVTLELKRQVEELKKQLSAKKEEAPEPKELALKVSTKGCVSLYGIRRFPVSYYKTEWERILGFRKEIKAFIKENESVLPEKK